MSSRAQDWLLLVGGVAIMAITIFGVTIGNSYEPNDMRSHAFDPLATGIGVVIGLIFAIAGIVRLLRGNTEE